jgi:hypothetical protein
MIDFYIKIKNKKTNRRKNENFKNFFDLFANYLRLADTPKS